VPFIFALLCFENEISFREKIAFLSDAKKMSHWEIQWIENHIFIIFSVSSHFALTGEFCRTSPGWIAIQRARARRSRTSQRSPQYYFWENDSFSFKFAWYYFKLHWNWTFGALSVSDRKIVYRVLSFFIKPWDFLIFYENALSGTVYMTRRFENTSIIPMINMAHVISSSCLLSPFIPLVNVSLLCHVQLVKRL